MGRRCRFLAKIYKGWKVLGGAKVRILSPGVCHEPFETTDNRTVYAAYVLSKPPSPLSVCRCGQDTGVLLRQSKYTLQNQIKDTAFSTLLLLNAGFRCLLNNSLLITCSAWRF